MTQRKISVNDTNERSLEGILSLFIEFGVGWRPVAQKKIESSFPAETATLCISLWG